MVKSLASMQEFQAAIAAPTLTVVDFWAAWCGPCKMIAPFYASLAQKYPSSTFAKVDVDQAQDIAKAQGVTAMPTFMLYRSGKKVGEMRGANPQQLELLIKQHAEQDASQTAKAKPFIQQGFADVTGALDQTQLDCLNAKGDSGTNGVKAMLKGEKPLESDCDEQLLINVGFMQPVKLHSLKFTATSEIDHAPRTVKLYVNRGAMSFDSCDGVEPTQVLELTKDDFAADRATTLQFVRFQRVSNLAIFIEDNQGGDDVTALKGLTFVGIPTESMDMKDWNPQKDH